MKTNNNGIDAELKSKTLKAARKAYFTRKYVRAASVSAACVAVIFAAAIFLPANKPFPDVTMEGATATIEKEMYVDEDVPIDEPLILCTSSILDRSVINEYNKIDGMRKVEIPDSYRNSEMLNSTILLKEFAAGEGPDIIIYTGLPGYTKSISQLARLGYLADIDKIANSHPDFELTDYNVDVLNSALIDNNRYYLPFQYTVKYHISSVKRFKDLGLDIPDELTTKEYFKLAEDFYPNVSDHQSLSYAPKMKQIMFDIMSTGKISYNLKTRKYFELFRKEEERAIISKDYSYSYDFKPLSGVTDYNDLVSNASDPYSFYNMMADKYFNGEYLFFSHNYLSSPKSLYNALKSYKDHMLIEDSDDSILIFPDQLNSKNEPMGIIYGNIAINANSKLKNESFNFIKYFMSEEVQSSGRIYNNIIPVNNASYDALKQEVLLEAKNDGNLDLVNDMFDILESASYFKESTSYPRIIEENDEYQMYLNYEISFWKMVRSVNRDLKKWFDENQ